jgi:hypothetical protein
MLTSRLMPLRPKRDTQAPLLDCKELLDDAD